MKFTTAVNPALRNLAVGMVSNEIEMLSPGPSLVPIIEFMTNSLTSSSQYPKDDEIETMRSAITSVRSEFRSTADPIDVKRMNDLLAAFTLALALSGPADDERLADAIDHYHNQKLNAYALLLQDERDNR